MSRTGQLACAGFKPGGEGVAHFFFGEGVEAAVPFCEGEAAIVFGFSCFGFLGSRPPFGIEAPPVAWRHIHACPVVNKPMTRMRRAWSTGMTQHRPVGG
jgi:hypothetical protein